MKLRNLKTNLSAGESGQAMTEYIILVAVIALGTTFMITKLPNAIGHYVEPFFFSFSRPLP